MKRWYAIQTQAGSELKIAEQLERRLRQLGLEDKFEAFRLDGEEAHFLTPIEEVITSKSRRGRSSEYRIPYDYQVVIEPNKRIQKGDLIAIKPPKRMPFDAQVQKIEVLQRVIIEMTNRNEEVFKIPADRRIRRDIRTGEKVPAGVPLTSDRDPQFTTKVKGTIVQRDRIKRVEFRRLEDGQTVVLEVPERTLVPLKEGLTLKRGDLLEKEDKVYARASGMVKIKEYKDKRVVTIQRIEKRRLFPGYIFTKAELTQDVLTLTQGLKARFVGNPPLPLADADMKVVQRKTGLAEIPKAERPKVEVEFKIGEVVEIVEGPFADFTGEIVEIDKENEEVTVMVKIFGRQTPVKLGFEGIEKI